MGENSPRAPNEPWRVNRRTDFRRPQGPPTRPRGRGKSFVPHSAPEPKDTLCRNFLLYGQCRDQITGCAYIHENTRPTPTQPSAQPSEQSVVSDILKATTLNVESPAFTPLNQLPAPAANVPKKTTALTAQAAAAPPFTPRGLVAILPAGPLTPAPTAATTTTVAPASPTSPTTGTPAVPTGPKELEPRTTFNPATIREFTPRQAFDSSPSIAANAAPSDPGLQYNPAFSGLPSVNTAVFQPQYNPYAEGSRMLPLTRHNATYYPHGYAVEQPPLLHHLYAPVGPYREDVPSFQRATHDFFIPESVRMDLQKRSDAALQTMPNSQLPNVEHYHSLVALDTSNRKAPVLFGYPTWVYKANSGKNGNIYCLRRVEGFRLTNELAIRAAKEWRRVKNGNVVSVHDAFTSRSFGDSSLIIVQDYHPMSRTLADVHSTNGNRYHHAKAPIAERLLWGYISQLTNALKGIHDARLAARCLDASKVLVTDKNRIRINACAILDVVQYENHRPLEELQANDLVLFGRLILALATDTPVTHATNLTVPLEQLSLTHSVEFQDTVVWLLTPQDSKTIDDFCRGIAPLIMTTLDESLHYNDDLMSHLHTTVENGRVARLLLKLGTINERHEYDAEHAWSETGERYMLKLFRDYVFHQVDATGAPLLDIGHMLRCLNKLDAGLDERVALINREETTCFLVSYKELKRQVTSAFAELQAKGRKKTRPA